MDLTSVKLILSDMDGTLLDTNGQLPINFYKNLAILEKHHIYFAPASGRSYHSLVSRFRSPQDNLIFISENGAHIVEKEESIFEIPITNTELPDTIEQLHRLNNMQFVLSGKKYSYIEKRNAEFANTALRFYSNIKLVDDLTQVDDQYFKFSIFDPEDAGTNLMPKLEHLADKFQIVLGAHNWLDLMDPMANKGTALQQLQQIMDITPAETMVFGDHMNDVEMLKHADFSFAMENAITEAKEVANYIAPHHAEYGVMQVIEELISQIEK